MSVRSEPFETPDLLDLEIQPAHAYLVPLMFRHLGLTGMNKLRSEWAWTFWAENGRPIAACGILPEGSAWAFLAVDCRRHMLSLTRRVRRGMTAYVNTTGPVYADIDPGYPEAVRWARALGFRPQTASERWIFDGA